MNYSKLYKTSITDGTGIRVSLYVSGCRLRCPGCHNPEAQDFLFGKKYTQETEDKIIELLSRPYVAGLTICGGEPMEPENQMELVKLVRRIRRELPTKNIWCYTGYEFVDLLIGGKKHYEHTDELLSMIDVLVAGRFDILQRDVSDNNRWRGSLNQRLVDVKRSLEIGEISYLENIPNNK